jgi:hypothetical protein
MKSRHRAQDERCATQRSLSEEAQEEQLQLRRVSLKLLEVPAGRRRLRAWSIGCHIVVVVAHGRLASAAQLQRKARNQSLLW